jgi:hypothetical protein
VVIGRGEVERSTDDEGRERTTKRILADACGPRWATTTVHKAKPDKATDDGTDGFADEESF